MKLSLWSERLFCLLHISADSYANSSKLGAKLCLFCRLECAICAPQVYFVY